MNAARGGSGASSVAGRRTKPRDDLAPAGDRARREVAGAQPDVDGVRRVAERGAETRAGGEQEAAVDRDRAGPAHQRDAGESQPQSRDLGPGQALAGEPRRQEKHEERRRGVEDRHVRRRQPQRGKGEQRERDRRANDADRGKATPVAAEPAVEAGDAGVGDHDHTGDEHARRRGEQRPQRRRQHAHEDERRAPQGGERDQARDVGAVDLHLAGHRSAFAPALLRTAAVACARTALVAAAGFAAALAPRSRSSSAALRATPQR